MRQYKLSQQETGSPIPIPQPPSESQPFFFEKVDAAFLDTLAKNMKFVAIFEIVMGIINSLTCVGAIYGIPQIFAALRLKKSADAYFEGSISNNKVFLEQALEHQSRYFYIMKIIYIIMIIMMALLIIFYIIVLIIGLSTRSHF